MSPSVPLTILTAGPFFSTPEQRWALARERFFEQGQRPTGLVSEAVLQSWVRCQAQGREAGIGPGSVKVSGLRLDTARRHARDLRQAAEAPLLELRQALRASAIGVALADPKGLLLDAWSGSDGLAAGEDWSEAARGCTAMALALQLGQAQQVRGPEHFFQALALQQSAAAPVLDRQGQVAGVLLLVVQAMGFGFDPVAVASQYASAIEHRLLRLQAGAEALVLEFQTSSGLLGTPLAGLLCVDPQGQVAWLNGVARRLTGVSAEAALPDVQALLGLDGAALLAWAQDPQARPLSLPNGLTVWLRPATRALSPATPAVPVVDPSPPEPPAAERLDDASRALIDRTLTACAGNVSQAAKQLGISRGRIYRHLQSQVQARDPVERNPS